jgi:alginate O-acetyltransferase complex protein AlgI
MIFSTPLFIFGFLPTVLFFYFLAPVRFRNHVALAFSFFFYAWGAPQFIAVVFLSCLFDWLVTNWLHAAQDERQRRRLMALGVASNLLILGHFKYTDFAIASTNSFLVTIGLEPMPLLGIALPIGISFITFEKITYIVDVYRGEGQPARSFLTYLLYVHFFPQLIAGPIIKYHDIEEQFDSRPYTLDNVVAGLTRFSMGLSKKVLIADSLAPTVDACFALPASQLDPATAWLGMVCYSLQIYFDFSGYSDMAIGLARAMGFHFQENFDKPYVSENFTEFWRRWHISLSTWIRSYLYIPLGGNRLGAARTYFNLWLCFLLSGLWHGASWNFLLWGTYHGFFLILDRLFWVRLQRRVPRFLNVGLTFVLTMLGWVVFRAETLGGAIQYYAALFVDRTSEASDVSVGPDTLLYICIGLFLSLVPTTSLYAAALAGYRRLPRRTELTTGLGIVLFIVSVGRVAGMSFSPFLYFRF